MQTYFEYCLLGCFYLTTLEGVSNDAPSLFLFLILLLHQQFLIVLHPIGLFRIDCHIQMSINISIVINLVIIISPENECIFS